MRLGLNARQAALFVAAALALFPVLAREGGAARASCDRGCLSAHLDRFFESMLAHDPALADLTERARFTENGVTLKPGQGLWGTLTGRGDYGYVLADPASQQVGFMGRVEENGAPLYYAVRLKIQGEKIAEIEAVAARQAALANLGRPPFRRSVTAPLDAEEKTSRAEIARAALSYFDAITSGEAWRAPFSSACIRVENGVVTAGAAASPSPRMAYAALGCADQAELGYFTEIRVDERRIWLIDEELGVALGAFMFSGDGKATAVTLKNGETVPVPDTGPGAALIAEFFKIRKGQIHEIEAVFGSRLPFGYRTGWSSQAVR